MVDIGGQNLEFFIRYMGLSTISFTDESLEQRSCSDLVVGFTVL